jgi:lactate permease
MALVFIIDRGKGVRETLPATLTCGVAFAITQFVTSNYISTQLTDIVASLVSALAVVLLLRVWQPANRYVELDTEVTAGAGTGGAAQAAASTGAPAATPAAARAGRQEGGGSDHPIGEGVGTQEDLAARDAAAHDTRSDVIKAYAPYLIVVVVFVLAQLPGIKDLLASKWANPSFSWPGLNLQSPDGKPSTIPTFRFNWLGAAGTLVLIAGLITIPVIGISWGKALRAYGQTYKQLAAAIVTVMAVLALAYVMNASGQTSTLGSWLAASGGLFAILSPILGWLGVAVTGSDTSSNSLFGALQVSAARQAGLNPLLMAASNSSGGVLGKMISPQNLAIAAGAVAMAGREGDIFRRVLAWSLGFLAFMCVLVYLQSTPVLSWMVP